MGVTYKVTNKLPQLIADLPLLFDVITQTTAQKARDIGEDTSPRDSGYMASTHDLENVDAMAWSVHVTAEYSAYVHNGTRFQRAQPWLANAAYSQLTPFIEAFRRIESLVR